jgi:hypothetical protein
MRCFDGYEVSRAVIRDGDTFALFVETPNGPALFYKHALISINWALQTDIDRSLGPADTVAAPASPANSGDGSPDPRDPPGGGCGNHRRGVKRSKSE